MKTRRALGRFLRQGAACAVAALVPSCNFPVIKASNGELGGTAPDPTFNDLDSSLAGVLVTSAAHDIPCARSGVSLVALGGYQGASVFTVEGCGQRATYMFNRLLCLNASMIEMPACRLVLIAKLAIGASGASGAATVGPSPGQ